MPRVARRLYCSVYTLIVPLAFIAYVAFAATTPQKKPLPAQTAADRENLRHVRTLISKRHGALTSDFSDPKQLAHTKWLLRRAGLTPEKYPQTYRSLDAAAVAHAKAKPTSRSLLQVTPTDTSTIYDYVDVVYVSSSSNDTNYSAEAVATFANTTDSVTTTLQLYEAETLTAIGQPAVQTTYAGQPAIVVLNTSATVDSGYTGEVLAEVNSVVNSSSSTGAAGGYVATLETVDPPASPPTVTQPVQATTTNETPNAVNVCLGRNNTINGNTYNCDQCILTNCPNVGQNPVLLQFQLSGNVNFSTAIEPPTPSNTTVTSAIMPTSGGACSLQGSSMVTTTALTTSNNNTTLTWNYNPTPSYGSSSTPTGCWSSGNQVLITYTITVAETNGNSVDVNVNNLTQSTCPTSGGQTPNSTPFCPVYFVWGCLAAETPITMADGSTKPISSVDPTDRVRSDAKGTILTVTDTVIGDEKIPMYRIRDKAGDEVFVTSAHPMVTANGIRLAKTLKVGDVVETIHGRSPITSIKRESYSGKVYNLILGAGAEKAGLNDDNRTMIAGGFVVGDNRMQTTHGKRFNSAPVNIMAKLPPRWRAEYKQWLADHPASKK